MPRSSNLPANVRTLVPALVGVIVGVAVAFAARHGVVIPADAATEVVTPVVSGAVTALYYAVARWLETRVPARVRTVGRLLLTWGLTGYTPAYVPAAEAHPTRPATP